MHVVDYTYNVKVLYELVAQFPLYKNEQKQPSFGTNVLTSFFQIVCVCVCSSLNSKLNLLCSNSAARLTAPGYP